MSKNVKSQMFIKNTEFKHNILQASIKNRCYTCYIGMGWLTSVNGQNYKSEI